MIRRYPTTILMAEDDPDDRFMALRALEGSGALDLRFVEDGQDLMDYLNRCGKYADPLDSPRPGVVLLDLNMPRKDGREALAEIKADPKLRLIPVVVLTTSQLDEDILRAYDLGVNSFITKPVTFEGLVEAMSVFRRYWLDVVALPWEESRGAR